MSRNPTTAAGVRLQGEADAITDEVARRTHTWIDQMRRGDNSPHRLKSILLGLSFAIIDHLPEDSLPEGWASLLAEYVDATADDSEPETQPNKRLMKMKRKLERKARASHRKVMFWTQVLQKLPVPDHPESILELVGWAARSRPPAPPSPEKDQGSSLTLCLA